MAGFNNIFGFPNGVDETLFRVFADAAARDAYYTVNMRELISQRTRILLEDGGSGDPLEQLWNGPSNPSTYDNTNWVDLPNVGNLTAAEIKILYESNANTNALIDSKNTILNLMTETTDDIVIDKSVKTPGASVTIGENLTMSDGGAELSTRNNIDNKINLFALCELNNAGTGDLTAVSAEAVETIDVQPLSDETLTDSTITFNFDQPEDALVKGFFINGLSGGPNISLRVYRGTDNTGTILYRHNTNNQIASGQGITLTGSEQSVNTTHPIRVDGGTTNHVEFFSVDGSDFTLRGHTNGTFAPFYRSTRWPRGSRTVATHDYVADSFVNAQLVGEDTLRFTRRDGTTQDVDLDDAEDFNAPRITNLSIDINPRVDLNTDLNAAHTITFDLMHQNNVQGNLTLEVTTGDNKTISSPFVDGENTKSVTLSGISTSTSGTVTFRLTGTDTQSNSFSSNVVSIEIRTLQEHEFMYYGLSSTNNPSSVDISTLTNLEITSAQRTYTITAGPTTAGQYFILLTPASETVSSIHDTVLNQDVTNIFTKTDDVRQINTVDYDSYVLGPVNAGVTENFIVTLS